MIAKRLTRAAVAALALGFAACAPEPSKIGLSAEQSDQVKADVALMRAYLENAESVRVAEIALAANRFRVLADDLGKASEDAAFDEAAAAFAHESMAMSAKSVRTFEPEALNALIEAYLPKVDAFESAWLAHPKAD